MKSSAKLLSVAAAATLAVSVSHAQSITNGSFEDDALTFTTNNGYVNGGNPAAITGWTASDGNVGINGRGAGQQTPFLSLSAITKGTSVGFIQRQGSNNSLSQNITGLTTGKDYWITYREVARQNNTNVSTSVQFGGSTVVAAHVLPTNGSSQVKIGSAYNATGSSATLSLNNVSTSGDQTALFDDVRIYYVTTPGAAPVGLNSSFETTNVTTGAYGSYGFTSGGGGESLQGSVWGIRAGGGIVGNGSGYGNPAATNGTHAGALQNIGSFSDVYGTFEAGVQYRLTLDVAARSGGGNEFSVSLGGQTILFGGNSTYTPTSVGSYTAITSDAFTLGASGPMELLFSGLNSSGDKTSFIDNIGFTVTPIPEPSSVAMLMGGMSLLFVSRRRRVR